MGGGGAGGTVGLEFLVLGPVQVLDEGRPLTLQSGRQTRLLAALLLSAGEIVSRDRLIDTLWGEQPPPTAAKALQVQIHTLRKLLGRERIATDGPGYRLDVAPGELDLERFERLVARGRNELATGDAEAAATSLREALALWRGPALADVAYEPFAQGDIARLEELRLVALEARIEADLALVRHEEIIGELESLVSLHPGRERLHGQLMLALYRSGRQQDALAVYRRARRALRDELGLDPGPGLQELQQAILRQDSALRIEPYEVRSRRHLPAPQTPLVGRQRELTEVDELLRGGGSRLVTLIGAGGIGKTRLGVQIAHDLADAFENGIYFVDLAPVREPDLVPSALADALGVDERPGQPLVGTLSTHLEDLALLLLLDNFETVVEAAPLLSALLQAAPRLALLVTSRTPLRLSGEHVYRVAPLSLPTAVRLFAERARAVAPGFRRPSEEAEEVAELCRRLDCLPLAIELAAARTRDYAPVELLQLFAGPLELASEGARDLPGRHRALRATIDWSYRTLEAEERGLFARLAVFVGGCTAAAATAVCDAHRSALASLAGKSLLQERLGRDGESRYFMLETVREFALEQLEASGETDELQRRRADYYTELIEAADRDRAAPTTRRVWATIDEEQDNFRASLDWSHRADELELELRLVGALAYFWAVRDRLSEGRDRLACALAHSENAPPALRAKALTGAARLAHSLGEYEQMRTYAEESLLLHRSLGDEEGTANALAGLGSAVKNLGDIALGIELNSESAEIYRRIGYDRGLAVSLSNIGCLLLEQGEHERAHELLDEALALFEENDLRDRIPFALGNLAIAALLADRPDDALALLSRGLTIAQDLDYTEAMIYGLEGMAAALARSGRAEPAVTLLGAADAAAVAASVVLEPLELQIHDEAANALKDALGGTAFDELFAAGRQIGLMDATTYALSVAAEEQPAADSWSPSRQSAALPEP